MVLTCPSVCELTYFRRGARVRVFITVDIYGTRTLGLRIQRRAPDGRMVSQWSGWHGDWHHTARGSLVCLLHYSGRTHAHTFHRLEPHVYQIWQGGQYIVVTFRMITLLQTQQQLVEDDDGVWEEFF